MHFKNLDPDTVSFEGGDEQTVRTSGGQENVFQFLIHGKTGPRLFEVDFDWSYDPPSSNWTLPWGRADMTSKPAHVWHLPWDRLDMTRKP